MNLTSRTAIPTLLLPMALLAGCGSEEPADGTEAEEETESPEDESTDSEEDGGGEADEAEDPGDVPADEDDGSGAEAGDVAVEVELLEDVDESTEPAFDVYVQFEEALWDALASGEVSPELESLSGEELQGALGSIVEESDTPVGGTVSVELGVDDVQVGDPLGSGMIATQLMMSGCADETGVEWESGEPGAAEAIDVGLEFDHEHEHFYVVELLDRGGGTPCG